MTTLGDRIRDAVLTEGLEAAVKLADEYQIKIEQEDLQRLEQVNDKGRNQ